MNSGSSIIWQKYPRFPFPQAVEEIRTALVRHNTECDGDKLKEAVESFLS